MSVLKSYFSNVEQNPPKTDDYLLKKTHGENGEEITIEHKVNYKEIQDNNGTCEMWDLEKMIKAGVDVKSISPKTENPTRAEGLNNVKEAAEKFVNRVKADIKKQINK